jgi:hypothetical protein
MFNDMHIFVDYFSISMGYFGMPHVLTAWGVSVRGWSASVGMMVAASRRLLILIPASCYRTSTTSILCSTQPSPKHCGL